MISRAAANAIPAAPSGYAGSTGFQIAATLFLCFRLFENVLFGGEPFEMNGGAGSFIYQPMLLLVCGSLLVSARPWEDIRRLLVVPVSVVVAFGWAWLSVLWSLAPGISFRRIAQLTINLLCVFVIVDQLGYRRTVDLLRGTFLTALIASVLYVLLVPGKGLQMQASSVDPSAVGSWRGIFIDKNVCGAFCAATMMLFMFDARDWRLVTRVLAIAVAAVFLIMSASKTALGVSAIAVLVGAMLTRYSSQYRALLVPLGVVATALLMFLLPLIVMPFRLALYDTTAFTGRGPIWLALIGYSRDHWLLGTGFSAFWAVPSSPVFDYSNAAWVRDTVRIGHNGYLDTLATLGTPGLVLVIVALIALPVVRVLASRDTGPGQPALVISIIILVAGQNLTESSLIHEKSFITLILLFMVALARTGSKLATAPGNEGITAYLKPPSS
jgi:O-antigen ligase